MTDDTERKPLPKLDGTPLENAKTILAAQAEEPYGAFGGQHAFAALKALVEDIEAKPEPERVWLNAMGLVRPSEETLVGIGKTVHEFLVRSGPPAKDQWGIAPWRRVTIVFTAS